MVKYYPEAGKSGFTVWRFLLRRDDPAPAPWTVEGKERMAQLGLELIVSFKHWKQFKNIIIRRYNMHYFNTVCF